MSSLKKNENHHSRELSCFRMPTRTLLGGSHVLQNVIITLPRGFIHHITISKPGSFKECKTDQHWLLPMSCPFHVVGKQMNEVMGFFIFHYDFEKQLSH